VSAPIVQERAGAVRFTVRVQPRASRSRVEGVHAGALKVRLTAPPVEGAANEALIALLAEQLEVPKRAIAIVSGASSRTKVVEIQGVTAARVQDLAAGR
jgi:uncharacterized protein (TIGR00251 family)